MSDRLRVYVFRSRDFVRASETVVSAAALDLVVSVYGGGGLKGEGGLADAFGGAAVFKDDATETYFLGVWGARNASRFRAALRASGAVIDIVEEAPPGRLVFYETRGRRPARQRLKNAR